MSLAVTSDLHILVISSDPATGLPPVSGLTSPSRVTTEKMEAVKRMSLRPELESSTQSLNILTGSSSPKDRFVDSPRDREFSRDNGSIPSPRRPSEIVVKKLDSHINGKRVALVCLVTCGIIGGLVGFVVSRCNCT